MKESNSFAILRITSRAFASFPQPMKKVDVNKISSEEWLAVEKEMWIAAYQVAMNTLVDQGGSESALSHLRPYIRMSAQAFSINMIKWFDIQGSDLDAIGDICQLYERFFRQESNEIERTRDRIVRVSGTQCPWRANPKEGCMTGHEMFLNEVCQAINPEYQCRFTQMITKGDPICSWVIEKKKG
jgi:hypothetical protein